MQLSELKTLQSSACSTQLAKRCQALPRFQGPLSQKWMLADDKLPVYRQLSIVDLHPLSQEPPSLFVCVISG